MWIASAIAWSPGLERRSVVPSRAPADPAAATETPLKAPKRAGTYRPWAELLKRTFGMDVLQCPKCAGPMKLVAMITDPTSAARYLRGIGELPSVPERSPSRGPPYWKSTVLRRKALGDGDEATAS